MKIVDRAPLPYERERKSKRERVRALGESVGLLYARDAACSDLSIQSQAPQLIASRREFSSRSRMPHRSHAQAALRSGCDAVPVRKDASRLRRK
jgi:hypothetical protein